MAFKEEIVRKCGAKFCRGCGKGCGGVFKLPDATGAMYKPERTQLLGGVYVLAAVAEEEHF